MTHINLAQACRRTEYADRDDERNPWAEWAVMYCSVFKHFSPKALDGVYATAFLREQMEHLKAKHAILARLGLKGAYHANEPMWLPNKVYARHPHWRGARGDNSLRTTELLFSPCVDQPEVLDLYREAVTEIVKAAPSIDTFTFGTNDAGATLCWTENAYPGQNGPSFCASRSMGQRVMGFLKAVRDAARAAGSREACAYMSETHFTPGESATLRPLLESGAGIVDSPQPDKPADATIKGVGGWSPWGTFVNKLPFPFRFVSGLEGARKSGTQDVRIGWYLGSTDPDVFTALKCWLESPPLKGTAGTHELVRRIAEAQFGAGPADDVTEAWVELNKSLDIASAGAIPQVLGMGVMANRWLVRPILATQEKLTEEEIAYFKRWVYQTEPDGWKDYLTTHRRRLAGTWAHASLISNIALKAAGHARAAAGGYRRAMDKADGAAVRQRLELHALRAEAQRCLLINVSNTVLIATLALERNRHAGRFTERGDPLEPAARDGGKPTQALQQLMRSELENTCELISLLRRASEPLLLTEDRKSDEGYFRFGPDVIEQLEKKAELIQRHWRDADGLFFMPTNGT